MEVMSGILTLVFSALDFSDKEIEGVCGLKYVFLMSLENLQEVFLHVGFHLSELGQVGSSEHIRGKGRFYKHDTIM